MPPVRVLNPPLSKSPLWLVSTAALAMTLMVGLGGCGRAQSASTRATGGPVAASVTPSPVSLPFPAPTSAVAPVRTREPNSGAQVVAPAESTATSTKPATPTSLVETLRGTEGPSLVPTIESSTATPTPGSQATAQPTSEPEPTAQPTPTLVDIVEATVTPSAPVIPTPFPTIDGVPLTNVGCDIRPSTEVKVGEIVTFSAIQEPLGLPLTFVFNHGNGTIDSRAVSVGRYDAPGTYPVSVQWSVFDTSRTVLCGIVTVTGVGAAEFQPRDYVGLSEGDARSLAFERGLKTVRVSRRDDEDLVGTTDFRLDRLNIEIDAGIVTTASIG